MNFDRFEIIKLIIIGLLSLVMIFGAIIVDTHVDGKTNYESEVEYGEISD